MKEASFLRRMGAWLYDVLIVSAVLMLAAGVAMLVIGLGLALGVIDLAGYIDTSDYLNQNPIAKVIYPLYLMGMAMAFYAYFWCRAGQTLGMRAWRLHLVNAKGQRITVAQAIVRMATSAFGLGNLVALFDPKNRTLQDHMAGTSVLFDPKVK